MQLVVGIEADDLRIREAEIGNDILEVTGQDLLERLNIPMLSQRSSGFDGAKASHLDLVRM